jgi:ParB family chromosome partitioning protein
MTAEPSTPAKPAWSAQVAVPATIEDARGQLGHVAALLLAGDWERAAICWAWTEPQQGKRTDQQGTLDDVMTSDSPVVRLSISEFAALGIRGLSSHVTVRKYREAWQSAMDAGKAAAAIPGHRVDLPDMDWPKAEGGGSAETQDREADWHTPLAIVKAARMVLGGIDLDPASTKLANEGVQAAKIWTAADDGLVKPWSGRVFLSPPAFQPELTQFCMRLATTHSGGDVPQAIAVLPAAPEADHIQNLGDIASGLCLPRGRVRFWHPDRDEASGPARAVMIFYLGAEPAIFGRHFAEFGMVW